jgi:hypothetical protein
VDMMGKILQNDKQIKNKQTNKQTKMLQISGNLLCYAFMLEIQLLIKYLP